jgi:cytochrome P450
MRDALRAAFQNVAVRALVTVERLQTGAALNPLDPRFRSDPYPMYRRLRERDPVHRSRLTGGIVLTRYADCEAVLKDARFSVDDRKRPDYQKNIEQALKNGIMTRDEIDDRGSMLRLDPPDHTRLRSLVSKAFTPRTVETLRPRIEQIVEQQLDSIESAGGMDVIRDLAYPLPVTVIAEMLGIPIEDRERFKHWSDEAVRSLGFGSIEDARRSAQANRELRAYLEPIVEQCRREPREDLISALVAAEEQGDKLSTDEVFSTIILLLVAGNETTTNLIGNGLLALLRNPSQLNILRGDPSLIENAVEELLRYDSPVQFTSRMPLNDVDLGGRTLSAGREVLLVLGAANRDPAQYDDPERLDVTRQDVHHLSFSHGIHFCLGAPLARLEGRIALLALVQRFPSLRLATSEPRRGDNILLRGLAELPVAF